MYATTNLFFKWANPGLFCLFSSFPHYTIQKIDESIDGVLDTQTWGSRMAGVDKSTELCVAPQCYYKF